MIEHYSTGPVFAIENLDELIEALDILHTQAMDLGLSEKVLDVLEKAKGELYES